MSIQRVVEAENVNDAYVKGLTRIFIHGVKRNSRNGPVFRFPKTLTSEYKKPNQRMLFAPGRDANPFFHILESIWMLSGSNDVKMPATIVPSMLNFSNDGKTFDAAYGQRWRSKFGFDQLETLAGLLARDPESRRCVLQIWSASNDLMGSVDRGSGVSKDVACNLLAKFFIIDGRLNMTVVCRSNDMVLGGYGANVVHFSFLQEFMLDWINLINPSLSLSMGYYEQISMDAHIYSALYSEKLYNGVIHDLGMKRLPDESVVINESADDSKGHFRDEGDYYTDNKLFTVSPISLRVDSHQGSPSRVRPSYSALDFTVGCHAVNQAFISGDESHLTSRGTHPYIDLVVKPLALIYLRRKASISKNVESINDSLDRVMEMENNLRKFLQDKSGFQPTYSRFDIAVACEEWLQRRLENSAGERSN